MRNHNSSLRYGKQSPSQEKTLNGARGARGELAFRNAGRGGGEDHEAGNEGREGNISGGWLVLVARMKAARARRSCLSDQRGESGPTSESPWRRRSLW